MAVERGVPAAGLHETPIHSKVAFARSAGSFVNDSYEMSTRLDQLIGRM